MQSNIFLYAKLRESGILTTFSWFCHTVRRYHVPRVRLSLTHTENVPYNRLTMRVRILPKTDFFGYWRVDFWYTERISEENRS